MTTDIERSKRRHFWTGVVFGMIAPTVGAVWWVADMEGDVRRNETALVKHEKEVSDRIEKRLTGVELMVADVRAQLAAIQRELELQRSRGR